MAFIETALLDRVAYGFTGGPTFATTRVELFSGIMARNAERSLPLYRYSAPYDAIETSNHDLIIAAFNACLGGLHGFRFKDRADYQLVDEVLGTSAGGQETMQLVKTYSFGGTDLVRTIKKPVTGTITLEEDGSSLAIDSIDTTTGEVTFTPAGAGKVITASGEFDVPVMFAEDMLQFDFVNWEAHSTDIVLIEDLSA